MQAFLLPRGKTMVQYFTPADSQKALANAATLDEVANGNVGQTVTSPNGRKFKTLATFDATAQQKLDALQALYNSADATTQAEISNLQQAINTAAAAGAGENGWTAQVVQTLATATGAVARTQQSRNDDVISIGDFGNNLTVAGNWIKGSVDRYCYLKAGQTYTFTGSGDVYFNRMICQNGRATVVVPANVNLVYLEKTEGSEVVHLENIDFIVLGHRKGAAGGTQQGVYSNTQGLTAIKSSYISGLNVYALTNQADLTSWSDDAGATRGASFIWVKVTDSAIIRNCKHYGFAGFYTVQGASAYATHSEDNVIGYNNETSIYVKTSTFSDGKSTNLGIINTLAQKAYFVNQANSSAINGKDTLLLEAQHTNKCIVDNVWAKNAIERSCYLQSANMYASRLLDDAGYSPANIKAGTGGFVYLDQISARNTENQGGSLPFYGFTKLVGTNFDVRNDAKNLARVFTFSDLGDVSLKGGKLINQGLAFYLTAPENVASLTIEDFNLEDCYSSSDGNVIARRSDSTGTLAKLLMRNISHKVSTLVPADIGLTAYQLNNITAAELINCQGYASQTPFDTTSCASLRLDKCAFTVISDTTLYNAFTRLSNAKLQANVFDFSVNFAVTTDAVAMPFSVNFKKMSDDGKVQILTHWNEINAVVPVLGSGNAARRLARLDSTSFELTATFGTSQIKWVYDAESKTITQIYNVGSRFATAQAAEKIAVYVNSSDGGLYVYPSATWSGGAGTVQINCKRF